MAHPYTSLGGVPLRPTFISPAIVEQDGIPLSSRRSTTPPHIHLTSNCGAGWYPAFFPAEYHSAPHSSHQQLWSGMVSRFLPGGVPLRPTFISPAIVERDGIPLSSRRSTTPPHIHLTSNCGAGWYPAFFPAEYHSAPQSISQLVDAAFANAVILRILVMHNDRRGGLLRHELVGRSQGHTQFFLDRK